MISTQDRWQEYLFGAGPHPIKTEKHDGAIGLRDRSDWTLDYKIPESRFSEAATGTGRRPSDGHSTINMCTSITRVL